MSRDVWGERRELLDYLLKDHTRRGGRLILPPHSAGYDARTLDQVNVPALVKQLHAGAPIELTKLLHPGSASASRTTSAAGMHTADAANPFGAPAPARSSASTVAAAANPFGAPAPANPAPSVSHSRGVSSDNPFGDTGRAGGPANPFGSVGQAPTGGDAFGKKLPKKGSAINGDPPVTTLTASAKLSYSTGALAASSAVPGASPLRGAQPSAVQEDDDAGLRIPKLDLPQLETGQTDDQLRDLAFMLVAACATATHHRPLVNVMRQQLLIDEGRAADVARVLRHIQPDGAPHIMDEVHGGGYGVWKLSQRASLEMLLHLVTVVRPSDFEAATPARAFKGFLRWKEVTVAVLERQLAAAVAAGWTGDKAQLRRLLAKMHGAARRADVRGEEDFEEEEYGEAVRSLAEVAGQLASGCSTGLRFPWAVRVRLCEILVTALFDTVDEGSLIDEAALVTQFMDSTLWPALGVSPPAALAVSAWVHFGVYVATREGRLVKQIKAQISKLAAEAEVAPAKASDPFGLGQDAGAGVVPSDELPRDRALASEVANHIVKYIFSRLSDYHAAYPGGENMVALLDVFCFACKSRGDGPERLAELLVNAISDSIGAEFGRQMDRRLDAAGSSDEARLLELASVVHDIHDADRSIYCSTILVPHMPEALAVACVQLHSLYGTHLVPWLRKVSTTNAAILDVFRTANALEQRLAGPVSKAPGPAMLPSASASPGAAAVKASATQAPAVADVLSSFERWDLNTPLRTALMQWVGAQVNNMNTWVARAVQTEKWRPMGVSPETSHCTSAAEVCRMADEALDALYGMDVPMPAEVPKALLAGIDGVMCKYTTHVNDKLGPVGRLIPPVPPSTRYKKDVVAKQETAELEAARAGAKGARKPAVSVFLCSVPTINASADYTNIMTSLTPEVLAAAACSLHYLTARLDGFLQTYRERQAAAAPLHVPAPSTNETSPAKSPPAKQADSSSLEPEPLSQARTVLTAGMHYACKFLATRLVFWDQRHAWLEALYRHHVAAGRIEPALEGLGRALAALAPGMPDLVRGAFARQLLVVAVQAIERVLLDGGPCRWFIPADVKALDQDLLKLRALFTANGEGLEREVVDGELERLRRLLPLLGTEVGPLMDLLKTSRVHGTAQLSLPDGSGTYAFDESTLLRVLSHRPERNGSKLIKALYKLPKKIK